MGWRERSIAGERAAFIDLASLSGANVSDLCARFGISRETGHLWLRRWRAGEGFDDRSRRPLRSPRQSPAEVEAAVLAVRDAHPAWGARKIEACLKRDTGASPSASTVHAILARHGRILPGAAGDTARGRFERDRPNELWQMDFKGRVRMAGGDWCHPLTVVDDHSRYAVCLAACGDERTATVRAHLETAFRGHGLPDAFYVDNGSPWGGGVPGQWTVLGVWLLKLGIALIHARPYHPQGRGKNERFHRSLKAEVLAFQPLKDIGHAQAAFDAWRPLYNRQRPHEALGMSVPADRYRRSQRNFPKALPEPHYDEGEITRRVGTTKTYVSFKGRLWKVPQAFAGETVALRPRGADGLYDICFAAQTIASIDLKDTHE